MFSFREMKCSRQNWPHLSSKGMMCLLPSFYPPHVKVLWFNVLHKWYLSVSLAQLALSTKLTLYRFLHVGIWFFILTDANLPSCNNKNFVHSVPYWGIFKMFLTFLLFSKIPEWLCGIRAWLVSHWDTGSQSWLPLASAGELYNTHAWPLSQSSWSILYGVVVRGHAGPCGPSTWGGGNCGGSGDSGEKVKHISDAAMQLPAHLFMNVNGVNAKWTCPCLNQAVCEHPTPARFNPQTSLSAGGLLL